MTVIKKLRHIELTIIPEITDINTSTEQLFLDHNQIGTLPKNIDRLENLQRLGHVRRLNADQLHLVREVPIKPA